MVFACMLLTRYCRYFPSWLIWNTSDFLWRQPPVIERILIFSSKLSFSICYIHLLISEVHDRLDMPDGAWPAEDEVDEVILLYKTSGSNLARDFYVLPWWRLSAFNMTTTLRNIDELAFWYSWQSPCREVYQQTQQNLSNTAGWCSWSVRWGAKRVFRGIWLSRALCFPIQNVDFR